MSVINSKALHELIRDKKMRSRVDARGDLEKVLDRTALQLVEEATAAAERDGRSTIMPKDIKSAKETVIGKEELSVGEILSAVEKLSAVEIADLSAVVRDKADEVLKP